MPKRKRIIKAARQWGRQYDKLLLLLISCLISWIFASFMVAIPFIVKLFGGSDTDVGVAQGVSFLCYVVGCIISTFVLDRFNGKRCVQVGIGGIVLVMIATYFTFSQASPGHDDRGLVLTLYVLSALLGGFSSAIWPSLMGWVSAQYEGKEFNKRLGAFSVSWSIGSLAGMAVGGILVQINPEWPFITTSVLAMLAFLSASIVPHEGRSGFRKISDDCLDVPGGLLLTRFRWISRVVLFIIFVCAGIITSQLGLLFKFELGFSESMYGLVMAVIMAMQMVVYYVGGKTHHWYFSMRYLWACHGVVMLGLLIVMRGGMLISYFVAACLLGMAKSLIYLSHLYYSASRSMRRSVLMAVHEAIIAVAISIGAVAGGLISDHFDRYMPYKFAFGLVCLSLVIQTVIRYYPRIEMKVKMELK